MSNTKKLHIPMIYTDGSCLKNPGGAGGWGFALIENDVITTIGYGSDPSTTNNRMELMAIIEALLYLTGKEYTIYTDSQWAMKCANGEWRRKANIDMWEKYDNALKGRKIHYVWVRGHNGDKYNELVDDLAREGAKKCEKK